MTRPKPPKDYDDNPAVDDGFRNRAKPTKESLESALRKVVSAYKTCQNEQLEATVEAAETLLPTARECGLAALRWRAADPRNGGVDEGTKPAF